MRIFENFEFWIFGEFFSPKIMNPYFKLYLLLRYFFNPSEILHTYSWGVAPHRYMGIFENFDFCLCYQHPPPTIFRKIFKTVSTPTVSLQSFWNFVQTSTGCCLKMLHEDFWKFWILNFWRIFFSKNHEPVFQIVSSPMVFLQSIWNFAYIFMRCFPKPLHGDFWKFWFLASLWLLSAKLMQSHVVRRVSVRSCVC